MLKKVWTDPVGSKVISAGIVGALVASGTAAARWWPAFGDYMSSSTSMPNWFLWTMMGFILVLGAREFLSLRLRTSPSADADPKIEISYRPEAPYEALEVQKGAVLSIVRIGVTNPGGRSLSNCKVYIEKISPDPNLVGGLPILLNTADFTVRHDDPMKLVDIAGIWNNATQFRFSAPIGAMFAEALGYMDADQDRIIVVKVVATECQRSASFRLSIDAKKMMHLEFLSYVN